MKILFAAVFTPKSTNVSQVNAMRRLGHEVIEFPYRETGYDAPHRDMFMCMTAGREKVDLVILSKCNGVDVSVVKTLRSGGTRVHLWFMDAVHNFNEELAQKVEFCDASFFALTESYLKAKEMVGDRAVFLQEGFDPDVDKPVDVPYEHDVTFIGNINSHPGNHRLKYRDAVKFECIDGKYGEEHARAVCSSRINLNFTHGGTSDRAYKTMAAGGFLLTEPWPGMEDDFTPGEDFDIFASPEELKEKISYWLLSDEGARRRVAERGMATVQRFSRDAWAERIAK